MNRADFQALSIERVADAQALLAAGRWSGAYYVAGYAVECALKACVAKQTQAEDFPDKDRAVKAYTHDLNQLLVLLGLKDQLKAERTANPPLNAHWGVVLEWSEQARYVFWDEAKARGMVAAVTASPDGVLAWITPRW